MSEQQTCNPKAEKYLTELEKHLAKMTRSDAKEVVQEIRSHIYESLARGTGIENTLEQLGNANLLAKTYYADYKFNQKKLSPSAILAVLQLGSLGIVGAVLMPSLFALSALIMVMAVLIIGIATTNLFEITQIPLMVITPDYTLTDFPQFVSAVLIAILMIAIGLGILKVMQNYCQLTINKYKASIINY